MPFFYIPFLVFQENDESKALDHHTFALFETHNYSYTVKSLFFHIGYALFIKGDEKYKRTALQ